MRPIEKYRRGLPVTILDKARTCETPEELGGFMDQLRKSPEHVSGEIWGELARMKVLMQANRT